MYRWALFSDELGGAGKRKLNFIIEGTNITSRFILGLSSKMKKEPPVPAERESWIVSQ
jgi:hypothetical protein